MNSSWKQLFYWTFLFLEAPLSLQADNSCLNNNAHSGRCIPLSDCPKLFKLASRSIISVVDRHRLQANTCGLRMVCCDNESIAKSPPSASLMTLPGLDDCGMDSMGSRVVGGSRTGIDQFRWTVALEYNKLEIKCGGSLINTRYIITAAHCVYEVAPNEITARLGEWDLLNDPDCEEDDDYVDPARFEKIDRILTHPHYKKNQNDIALLRLESALPSNYTKYILPICLPVADQLRSNLFSKQKVSVAGWGATEAGTPAVSQYKMFAELVTTSLHDCISDLGHNLGRTKLDRKHLCAKSPTGTARDTCGGDSGGPLQINLEGNFYLIGVVSFGPPCGTTLLPGVYTRITHYIDWIVANLVE